MKKISLGIDDSLMSDLGLNNSSDDAAIAGAIKAAIAKGKKADELQNKLENARKEKDQVANEFAEYKKKETGDKVKNMLKVAVDEKMLTQEAANELETSHAENPEGLTKILNSLKPYTPVATQVKEGQPKNQAELAAEYDKLHESDGLAAIKNSNPARYEELMDAKFPNRKK